MVHSLPICRRGLRAVTLWDIMTTFNKDKFLQNWKLHIYLYFFIIFVFIQLTLMLKNKTDIRTYKYNLSDVSVNIYHL